MIELEFAKNLKRAWKFTANIIGGVGVAFMVFAGAYTITDIFDGNIRLFVGVVFAIVLGIIIVSPDK